MFCFFAHLGSVQCGRGTKERTRKYLNPGKARKSGCTVNLIDSRKCEGNNCPSNNRGSSNRGGGGGSDRDREPNREDDNNNQRGSDENTNDDNTKNDDDNNRNEVPPDDTNCQLSEWSDEGCTCENGQKREHREFRAVARNLKGCKRKYQYVELERFVPCVVTDCAESARVCYFSDMYKKIFSLTFFSEKITSLGCFKM